MGATTTTNRARIRQHITSNRAHKAIIKAQAEVPEEINKATMTTHLITIRLPINMAKEGPEVLITMEVAAVEVMAAATHTITTTIRIQEELDTQGTLEELALATDKILIKKERAQEINSLKRRSTKLSTITSRKVKRFQIKITLKDLLAKNIPQDLVETMPQIPNITTKKMITIKRIPPTPTPITKRQSTRAIHIIISKIANIMDIPQEEDKEQVIITIKVTKRAVQVQLKGQTHLTGMETIASKGQAVATTLEAQVVLSNKLINEER